MHGEVADRAWQYWWKADSPGYMENLFFMQLLTRYDVDMEIVTGNGWHDFTDYAANGSVQETFEFVLREVTDDSTNS